MSNILKTQDFLNQKTENYVTIVDQETNRNIGKNAIYAIDIPHGDLKAYILNNCSSTNGTKSFWIELRTKSGATSKKINHYSLVINPDSPAVLPVAQPAIPATPTPAYLPQENNSFGLGFPQMLKMATDANKLEDKCKEFDKLEKKYDDAVHENKAQDIEIRTLKTELSMATAKKDMEVLMAKMENKSFLDSDAFKGLVEKAPDLISAIAAMKGGGAAANVVGALGAPKSSHKAEFLEFVNENLTDDQVSLLGNVCRHASNATFMNQLNLLFQQHGAN